jgi:HSP20 family protein
MKLINWTPRPVSLFDDMDRMVKTVFNDNLYSPIINKNWVPAVDIKEDNISFVLTADIPGLSKSNIDLLVEDNMLKISGIRDTNNENDNGKYHYKERTNGTFHRSFKLPSTVDEENISASFRNGILTVVLPKTEEVQPKQRSIKIK